MNRLRNRLILVFLAATLAPLGVTLWITTRFLDTSLHLAARRDAELDEISRSLERTGKEFYQRARAALKRDATSGRLAPDRFATVDFKHWPGELQEFWDSGEADSFELAGVDGDRLDYLIRRPTGVDRYSSSLSGVGMERLSEQIRSARQLAEVGKENDLRRGFIYTYMLVAAVLWIGSLGVLIFLAHRVSRPIHELTAGLSELARGNLTARVSEGRNDEVGRAMQAFNHMAAQLQQSTERLVYLTQLASWQMLARKMAHEVKNSLTPIRLTVEEMLARHSEADRAFLEQAAQIVVDEVESLERRVRAFSEFAAEPPLRPSVFTVNSLLEERIQFLRSGHPEITYSVRLEASDSTAYADEDLVKGVLTNLLENAAEAAGPGGQVLAVTASVDSKVLIEVHDSGPGLSDEVRQALFQPTISFKKRGMGLGLSIARKSALLMGGDILSIPGELRGAAFRVLLPASGGAGGFAGPGQTEVCPTTHRPFAKPA